MIEEQSYFICLVRRRFAGRIGDAFQMRDDETIFHIEAILRAFVHSLVANILQREMFLPAPDAISGDQNTRLTVRNSLGKGICRESCKLIKFVF